MKMPSSVSKLLTNRYVLFLVSFLALFNVIVYIMLGNTKLTILFILIGYLATFFSKNMVIVLLVPLLLVNLLTSGKVIKEGLEGVTETTETTTTTTDTTSNPEQSMEETPSTMNNTSSSEMTSSSGPVKDAKSSSGLPGDNASSGPVGESRSSSESFSGAGARKGSSRVDMGSTLEQAYDDLNNVLGSDGIKSLTNDTQNLMKQQLHLAEAMKEMGPLMQQAQGMLKTLNIDGLGDISSLIKKFGIGNKS